MSDRLNDLMDRFYTETGVWPPGRDMPDAMCGGREPDARDVWEVWCQRERLYKACKAVMTHIDANAEDSDLNRYEFLDELRTAIAATERFKEVKP